MRAVNLIPPDQRGGGSVGAGRSGGAAYAVLALLLGFAVLAVVYGKSSRTNSNSNIASGADDLKAGIDLVLRETGRTRVHLFGESSGGPAPIAVENFRVLRDRQTADTVAGPAGKAGRVNLLNWDGKGGTARLMPPRRGPDDAS